MCLWLICVYEFSLNAGIKTWLIDAINTDWSRAACILFNTDVLILDVF